MHLFREKWLIFNFFSPMHKSPLGVHEVEFVIESGPGFLNQKITIKFVYIFKT